MALYIGVTTASSELTESPINTAITNLAAATALKTREGRIPEGPSLDVTFMLPGKLERPLFSGMRMGGYTRAGDTLYFEAAVPEGILHSRDAGRYVALVMEDAVSNAETFFADTAISFDATRWQALVAQVTGPDALGGPAH